MNNQIQTEIGHRVVPLGDTVAVEAWAPSRSGCLEELVRGVVNTFADTDNLSATREVPLEVGAARDEDVVVALVDDIHRLLDTDGLVVVDVALDEEDDGCFDGTFFVVPGDAVVRVGAGPRDISRADLHFAFDGSLWRAHVQVSGSTGRGEDS